MNLFYSAICAGAAVGILANDLLSAVLASAALGFATYFLKTSIENKE